MNKFAKGIPVLIGVLVFIFLLNGCSGKEIISLDQLQRGSGSSVDETEITVSEMSDMTQPADSEAGGASVNKETQSSAQVPAEFAVHICGAVCRPGVYLLEEGSRICDVIRLAGGLSSDASDRSINQAALITDGMQIIVPTVEEAENMETVMPKPEETAASESGSESNSELLDLNTATYEELMTLPGIGETRAKAILAYREKNGKFSKIEEIMQVNGIKEGSFEKLREYITVR